MKKTDLGKTKVYLSAEAGKNSEQVIADLTALLAGR